jgi:hypothetical protein
MVYMDLETFNDLSKILKVVIMNVYSHVHACQRTVSVDNE